MKLETSSCAPDAVRLYTERKRRYVRFVNSVGYPQGIRACFLGSPLLRSDLHVLDAGCGTGIVLLALRDALLSRGFQPGILQGFDLTPKMLEGFRETLRRREIDSVNLVQADVLQLTTLPHGWDNFDLIVSSGMLEYLPRTSLVDALSGLRSRLNDIGSLLLFISRRSWLMKPLIGRWWDANLYHTAELEKSLRLAGFSSIEFGAFPTPYRYLSLWGHVVEAR